jgi:hypothetical protein
VSGALVKDEAGGVLAGFLDRKSKPCDFFKCFFEGYFVGGSNNLRRHKEVFFWRNSKY